MKKVSLLFFIIINLVITANAQTLLWRNDDSTYNSGSGHVLALPHNEMFVVANTGLESFAVFKYDENGNPLFQKNFAGRRVTDQLLDADANLFVAGNPTDSVQHGFVAKIDTNGNEVWEVPIMEAGYILSPHDLTLDNSGNSYLVGTRLNSYYMPQDIAIYKISNSGSLVWAKYFGDSTNLFWSGKVTVTPDGKILVAYSEEDTDPNYYYGYLQLLKYDTAGNLIWHHEITDDSNGDDITMRVSELSVANDGSIYVCGNASALDLGMGRDYPYVVKLDSSGNKIWLKEIFDHGILFPGVYAWYYSGTLGEDGSYYAAGVDTLFHIVVVKFSTDGDVMWIMNHLPMYNTSTGRINNIKIHNGFLFAAGSLNELSNNTDYLVIASDLNGTIQWTARYNSQNNDYNDLVSLDFDNDHNVLVSGSTHKAGQGDYYTTTIKYSNQVNGIPSASEDDLSCQVFPNPAGEEISVLPGNSSIKIKSLLISDECGRRIKEVMWTGTMENHIDVHDFSSGIYFFRANTEDGKFFSGKFVKQ